MFWEATTLPLWMVMEIRWKIYCVFNGSDVTMVNLLPISCASSVACAFHGPPVSIVIGKNKCVPLNFSYFAVLFATALSATAPAVREVFGRCDGAKVSGTVASHGWHVSDPRRSYSDAYSFVGKYESHGCCRRTVEPVAVVQSAYRTFIRATSTSLTHLESRSWCTTVATLKFHILWKQFAGVSGTSCLFIAFQQVNCFPDVRIKYRWRCVVQNGFLAEMCVCGWIQLGGRCQHHRASYSQAAHLNA